MLEWRNIEGWPYQVSNLGFVRRRNGRLLTPMLTGEKRKQYETVRLCRLGERKDFKVHILVLTAFVGVRPDGMKGLHRDDDTSNNALSNLYWGTNTENARDCVINGDGLDETIVRAIKAHPKYRGSGRELASRYGISEQLVCDIRKGRCYGYL